MGAHGPLFNPLLSAPKETVRDISTPQYVYSNKSAGED
jgi:hypothetical protein